MESRRILSRLSLLLAGVVVAGCAAGDGEAPPADATPRSVPAPAFVSGEPCPRERLDGVTGPVGCSTNARGDADGDGSADLLTVYARLARDEYPRAWRLRLNLGGRVVDLRLDAGNRYSYPRAIGAADVDGDERTEFWVKVVDFASHGAPWQRLGLFWFDGDTLRPVVGDDGEPLPVNVGGIARLGEGASCGEDALVLLRAEAKNPSNTRWETSMRSYVVRGPKAELLGRRESVLTISDYNDPDLDPFYRLDCGDLRYPS